MSLSHRPPIAPADFIVLERTAARWHVTVALGTYARDHEKPAGQAESYLEWFAAVLHWGLGRLVSEVTGTPPPQ